jgi:predicted permease
MCEVTFCLALVISASLLVRSYSRLQSEDRGFSTAGVLTANITLPEARYPSARKRAEFFRHLVARAAAIPGVSSAAAVRFLPMSGVASMWSISIPGRPSADLPAAFHHVVTPKYFEVLNIPLLEGRWFDEHDSAGRSRVAIISAAAARRYFPDNPHPVGQNIRIHDEQRADWEVVGIVGDVRNLRPDMAPRPQVYVPMEQTPMSAMTLVLRNNESSLALSRSLRNVVSAIDKEQAISEVKTLDSVVADASARWRVSASIFVMFGLAALALALIGLYGVVSYTIAQRKTEIAIRIALGSSYPGIIRMILRSVAVLGVMGTGLGLLLAVGAVQGIRTFLYTIEPLDFIALGMPAAGFLALVLIISAAAASKATRISPSLALKSE